MRNYKRKNKSKYIMIKKSWNMKDKNSNINIKNKMKINTDCTNKFKFILNLSYLSYLDLLLFRYDVILFVIYYFRIDCLKVRLCINSKYNDIFYRMKERGKTQKLKSLPFKTKSLIKIINNKENIKTQENYPLRTSSI